MTGASRTPAWVTLETTAELRGEKASDLDWRLTMSAAWCPRYYDSRLKLVHPALFERLTGLKA